MRFAWLRLVVVAVGCVVGCAGRPATHDLQWRDLGDPPPATFRWALEPTRCDDGELRSTVDTCGNLGTSFDRYIVAAFAPTAGESRVAVMRYDGDVIGAPLRWQQHVDLGLEPHSAVITTVRGTVIASAISNGAVRVVAIDLVRGRVLGTATIVERDARVVQVEGVQDHARIHVRTGTGGVVAVMNPRTARVIASRVVDEAAIVEKAEVFATAEGEATSGEVTLRWEANRLVLRRGTWFRYLRVVERGFERSHFRVTLQRYGDRVIASVFDQQESSIEVRAFDHDTGDEKWRRTITGGTRNAFTNTTVGVGIADEQILVTGDSGREVFTCTLDFAGAEQACVDRRRDLTTVIDFEDGNITP